MKQDTNQRRVAGCNFLNQSPTTISRIINREVLISFPVGIPAFEDAKYYTLVSDDSTKPFICLNSADIPGLGFVCIDPFLFFSTYAVNLSGKDLSLLGLSKPDEALVLSLVTIYPDPKQTTANLRAPIVVNIRNLFASQVILERYPVNFNIWTGLNEEASQEI